MAASEELAEKAKEAFVDDDFEMAVNLYTQAISLNPQNADFFADCAQANIKLNNFTEAVGYTNKAIELDRSMAKAYLRKGVACFKLEEYHTAKVALEIGSVLAQNDSRFTQLIAECDKCIKEENMVLNNSLRQNWQANNTPVAVETLVEFQRQCKVSDHSDQNLKQNYRHEFYQTPDEVVTTIFAKGVSTENVVVQFDEQILSVRIKVLGKDTYHFHPQLFGKIIPDKCRYQVLSTKIEVRLAKAKAVHWASLEYGNSVLAPQKVNVSSVSSKKPVYPTSKPGTKDWDKFEAQVKKEELEEKLRGDEVMNEVFQMIYKEADEDSRRAMEKSYVESKGVVVSMDWEEVGLKKVESSRCVK